MTGGPPPAAPLPRAARKREVRPRRRRCHGAGRKREVRPAAPLQGAARRRRRLAAWRLLSLRVRAIAVAGARSAFLSLRVVASVECLRLWEFEPALCAGFVVLRISGTGVFWGTVRGGVCTGIGIGSGSGSG